MFGTPGVGGGVRTAGSPGMAPRVSSKSVATTLQPALLIRLEGQASKRGLIPRMPGGERLLTDIAEWLTAEYPDEVRATPQRTLPSGLHELHVTLHPAAPDLLLRANDDGEVTAAAETLDGGPGYHRFVGRVLERVGREQSIDWNPDTAGLAFAERPEVETAYLAWLGPALGQVRNTRKRSSAGVQIGLPAGTKFTFEGALATALGPRDDDWLESAYGNPRVAIEVTPWWSDATDSRYMLNRALTLMWLHVRWRKPAIDGEAEVLDDVHRLLSRAYPVEPGLPYPWHAWAELVAVRGLDDAMARQVNTRVKIEPAEAPIGYRRDPVTITHEGWALEVPGDFAERRTEEEWWGGGAGRGITLAATDIGDMSAHAFLAQVASDLGADVLSHQAGPVVGRGRITTDSSSGVEVGVLDGFSAVNGSGAAIRIVFEDPADWQWALEMWRSLAPG
jgi:hypothetical protein